MNTEILAIELKDLCKSFGSTTALQNVSMRFDSQQMHGVIGPEGAGKTTLLRIVLGLMKATSGEVIYTRNGERLDFESLRPSLSYMPQQQSLYSDLSVQEHLEFFKELYGIDPNTYDQRRKELLQITRLEGFIDRPAGKLSGGMYKKLGLMCALLRSPKVLLLDEPTNGVDPISRREFWELLYGLADRKILIVVTTAYMDEAERCGQVHLMESGHLVAEGDPRELLKTRGAETFDQIFVGMGKT